MRTRKIKMRERKKTRKTANNYREFWRCDVTTGARRETELAFKSRIPVL